MGLLTALAKGPGYLKAGFLGFPKSGKTRTAIELAVGTREAFGLKGPIAMMDTEGGSDYIAERVRERTGLDLMGYKGRAFDDMMTLGRDCIAEGVSVFVVDSITHVWRELCQAYLQRVNANRPPTNRKVSLELLDWARVKEQWAPWTDFYLNSPLHIIVCGRAGFEWDMQKNEDTGKNELRKTGVKMKTEAEFGFEPSLLVEMERVQESLDSPIVHRATIIGDRFGLIDGKTCDDPTFEFFAPHVVKLTNRPGNEIDTAPKSQVDVDGQGDSQWARERKTREILCEEIQGELTAKWPGQSAAEKQSKADIVFRTFNTRSWTAVEGMASDVLRKGLEAIRTELQGDKA